MSRIRTIKPEFWSSEQVMECSTNARLLFIGIWNFCDDAGRHPHAAKQIKALVFPGDDFTTSDVAAMLDEIERQDLIRTYEIDGKRYFFVTGWNHQKIDRCQKPRYPEPSASNSSSARRKEVQERHDIVEGSTSIIDNSTSDRRALATDLKIIDQHINDQHISEQRPAIDECSPSSVAAKAAAVSKRLEPSDDGGGAAEFRKARDACIAALGGYLTEGGIAPADAHFGPMMALIDQGVSLKRIVTVLRSFREKPPRNPIKSWSLWATKVAEAIAATPEVSKAAAAAATASDDAVQGGRVEFPGGHSATVATIGKALDRGGWIDAWHGKIGTPNCKIPEWAISELRRRGHLAEAAA